MHIIIALVGKIHPLSTTLLLVILSSALPCHALQVYEYSSTNHERFVNGVSSTGALNSAFFAAPYDLTAVGISSSGFNVTLISPRHFITVAHINLSAGSSVTFVNNSGTRYFYTIASIKSLRHPDTDMNGDIVIGTLTTNISSSTGISPRPFLRLPGISSYRNLNIIQFGKNHRAGINQIVMTSNNDYIGSDGLVDSAIFTTVYQALSSYTQAENGDSGSPAFIAINGELALVGCACRIAGVSYTMDIAVGPYYADIQSNMASNGWAPECYIPGATSNSYLRVDYDDSDFDTLSDAWEISCFGSTNAVTPSSDPDLDGLSNWDEFRAGTHPTNALSVFKLTLAASDSIGSRNLWWYGTTNSGIRTPFHVLFTTNLAQGSWSPVTTNVSRAPTGTNYWQHTNATASPAGFYRIAIP